MQEGKILVQFENNILKTINFHWNNDIPLDSANVSLFPLCFLVALAGIGALSFIQALFSITSAAAAAFFNF